MYRPIGPACQRHDNVPRICQAHEVVEVKRPSVIANHDSVKVVVVGRPGIQKDSGGETNKSIILEESEIVPDRF